MTVVTMTAARRLPSSVAPERARSPALSVVFRRPARFRPSDSTHTTLVPAAVRVRRAKARRRSGVRTDSAMPLRGGLPRMRLPEQRWERIAALSLHHARRRRDGRPAHRRSRVAPQESRALWRAIALDVAGTASLPARDG